MVFPFGSQGDGYWNKLFIEQVKTAIRIAGIKYPITYDTLVFLLDQSSGHSAYVDDALITHKMSASDGGKQPFFRDTAWDRKPQNLVTSTRLMLQNSKGLKTSLEERGVHTNGL